MRIHAKLHCQNMQKNTTLQENDLKIPAKFGMRMGGGTDISLGLTAAEVGDLIKVRSVDENGKPTAWERVETIDGTLTEASDNSLGITSATVGQIAKITAIDKNGKPTGWEAVDMPMPKTLKWITVYSTTLTEATNNIVVSADANGKPIADYNPVGLILLIATPADATQGSNNGNPWVYPTATKSDNAIRAIGTIAGWKTIARDSAFAFMGNSSALVCTGNVNTTLSSYKVNGYKLDGVKAFLNNANDHFPEGTRIDVNILSEIIS